MAEREVRITLRDRQTVGGLIPSNALMGEPFINLFDGVLRFSGVTGGGFETSSQPGVFEVGSTLYNQKITNRLSVNGNFIISGDTGLISTYAGASGSGLSGKFLSGTTSGFVLGNISDIAAASAGSSGDIQYNNGSNGFGAESALNYNSSTDVLRVPTLSATTLSAGTNIYSAGTSLETIIYNIANSTENITLVQPGSNIQTGGTASAPIISVVSSPSFNNISFSGVATGGALSATSITASTLTNTRVLFAGPSGLISDDAGMTYNSSTDVLTVNGNLTTNGTQYSGGTIVDDGVFTIDAATSVQVDSVLLPTTHLAYNLGAIGQRWNRVYARSFHAGISSTEYGDGYITGDSATFIFNSGNLSINGNVFPSATTTYDLGSSSFRWNKIYTKDLDVTGALATTGITVSGLLPGSVVYAGTGGALKTEAAFAYDESIDTLVTTNLQVGNGSLSGNVTIFGDLTVVGSPISAFTSQLYIEDNNIILNYNPTATTQQYSLGAGLTIQDGSGIAGTDVFLDVKGSATGVQNRAFTTNLSEFILSESGTTSSPSGLYVLKMLDTLDGGNY